MREMMNLRNRENRFTAGSSGFGMIEIVVSMFLIALMAMAVLPVMISSMKLTTTNVVVTRATQVVSSQLDLARQQGEFSPTCAAIQGLATATPIDVVDPNGEQLRYKRSVGSCPSSYPGTVAVTVTVTMTTSGAEMSTAKTLIAVSSAT